jgi:histidinol-phosphate phosphatase family protein
MRAIFLDRDGVINRYPGDREYVKSWEEFHFIPGARLALKKLSRSKFKVYIVSNQAGVSKGLYSRKTLSLITQNMLRAIEASAGRIDGVYYCTHHSERNCSCRKPRTGLIDRARKKFPIDIKRSYFIGDTIRDVKTAVAAGCRSVLVFSGKEKPKNRKDWEILPDYVFSNLLKAVEFILNQK